MCKCCEEDGRKKRDFIINTPIISLKIVDNNRLYAMKIKSYNSEKQIVDNYKLINYCPMCGRKLGD